MSAGRWVVGVVAAAALAGAGGGAGYWYAAQKAGMREYDRQAAAPPPPGKKVLYWHDPMYPQHKFDKPGKSPFMEMQLVPVYGDDDGGSAPGVRVDPGLAQNLGLRTSLARKGSLAPRLAAVGSVAYDENQMVVVQARASGWIEVLHVRAPGDTVTAGAPLASIVAPEWLAAQEEYLALRRAGPALPDLVAAARARLTLLGVPEEQIASLDREGRPASRVTLSAPQSGVVVELGGRDAMGGLAQFAREGMQVSPGMTLFRIAGLAQVWVIAEIPEAQAGNVAPGTRVVARVAALPDRRFEGQVATLLPDVDPVTRTLKARIRLANPGLFLKPGMFADLSFAGSSPRAATLVPAEALIETGRRKVVIVVADAGRGRPHYVVREVETGGEADGMAAIVKGVASGERVVVSGQFLIDSEASLKAFTARLEEAPGGPAEPAKGSTVPAGKTSTGGEHSATGRVESISGTSVTLSHGPVPSLKWPGMTMQFTAPAGGMPSGVGVGDAVTFDFVAGANGSYRITRIERAPVKAGGRP
ncbi:MAG: efflux RND transporter periplasmic adaptor subunit [Burkholderiales bacterium]|nr:efflux RND transporter periplasmic adaptor subunit [Burkholderiales bacterium]